jgi:hypothetical protein
MDIDSPTTEKNFSMIDNPFILPPLTQPPMTSLPEEPFLMEEFDLPSPPPPPSLSIGDNVNSPMLSNPPQSQTDQSDNPFILPPLIAPPTASGPISQTMSDTVSIQSPPSDSVGASYPVDSQRTLPKPRRSKRKISVSCDMELEGQGFSLEDPTGKSQ